MRRHLLLAGALCLLSGHAALRPLAAQQPRATVRGLVLEPSGRPVADATIRLEPQNVLATSDERGRFVLSAVLAGDERLIAQRIGYRTTVRRLELVAGKTVHVRIEMPVAPVTVAELVTEGTRAGRVGVAAVGGSVVELSGERLRASAGRSAGELLVEAGVGHVTARGGAGSSQAISIRGARPEGVLVLLDGVPLNDPITGYADLSLVPVESLEEIRVVPGVGGALYGPGAVGGVVLLSRRSPAPGGYFAGGLGMYGWQRAGGGVGMNLGAGTLGLSARVAGAENDYPFTLRVDPGHPTVRRANADASELTLGLDWRAPGDGLGVSAGWAWSERGVPGPMGTSVFDGARAEVSRGDVGARWSREPWALTGRVVAFRHAYRDPANPSSGGTVRSWSVDASAHRSLAVGSARGAWLVSVRGDWARGTSLAGRPWRGSLAAGVSVAVPLDPATASVALRVDALEPDGVFVSPGVGFALPVGGPGGLELHGRVGRGVRAPTFADLYFASPIPALRPDDLAPERVVLDAELGLRAGGSARRRAALTGYVRSLRDAIVWAPSSFVGWRPLNVERVRAYGIEASAWAEHGPASLEARYEWVDSRFDLPLNHARVPYVPEHQLTGTLGLDLLVDLRLRARYLGSRTAGLTGADHLPAVAWADVAASLPLRVGGLGTTLTAEVQNAFDARYELVPLYPMPGREVRLTTQLRWGSEEER